MSSKHPNMPTQPAPSSTHVFFLKIKKRNVEFWFVIFLTLRSSRSLIGSRWFFHHLQSWEVSFDGFKGWRLQKIRVAAEWRGGPHPEDTDKNRERFFEFEILRKKAIGHVFVLDLFQDRLDFLVQTFGWYIHHTPQTFRESNWNPYETNKSSRQWTPEWIEENQRLMEPLPHFKTGWWFQIFFISPSIWGRFPFWRAYFSNGLVQQPTRKRLGTLFKNITPTTLRSRKPGALPRASGSEKGSREWVVPEIRAPRPPSSP